MMPNSEFIGIPVPQCMKKKTVVGVFVDCSLTNKENNLDAVMPHLCNHKLSWH
jgi:hypothetical protein